MTNKKLGELVTRLGGISGVKDIEVTETDSVRTAVDFNITFPSDKLVDEKRRIGAITRSSMIIQTEGCIDIMTLRLPPVDSDIVPKEEFQLSMKELFPDSISGCNIHVHIQAGTITKPFNEWWPHINTANSDDPPKTDTMMEMIEQKIPEYYSLAREIQNRHRK
jgi:hypothetical protein